MIGAVSLAGSQGGLWSVEGGNWRVCGLLSSSKATVYFFDCKGCRNWPSPKELGEFWRTEATFVHGHVNLTHFGFGTEYDIPEVIGTTETP
ncbi:unnamed protein product [Porites lobata]|uniref:Prenylcysteine lyase domain-containing protein n=1 Tax=Porites lobata TaxID=104759 RepID=A0ABN8QUG0_9CNID|nr:unnamed protein product [Porites lobata]